MFKHTDPFADTRPPARGSTTRPGPLFLGAVAIVLLALIGLAAGAAAAPAGADRGEADQLLADLGGRYEILTLAESWVLRSTAADAPFDIIEVRAGSVSVDGEEMDRAALRQLVGDDADLVHSLAELGRDDAVPAAGVPAAGAPVLAGEERGEGLERRKVQTDTRISFGSSLTIQEDEIARDVVVIGGALDVAGAIDGDATVIGGPAEIRGEVDGTVTAVGGSVSLGPEALVDGDVSAIGGVVHRDSGARVHGEITEMALGDWEGFENWSFAPWSAGGGWFAWTGLVEPIVNTMMLVGVVFLILLVAGRYTTAVADRIDREPWKAALVGFAAQALFLPVLLLVFLVLMVSIIGIPLALLLLPASLLVAVILCFLGYAGAALFAGRRLGEHLRLEWYSSFLAVLFGVLLIQGWSVLGEGFSLFGGPIKVAAFLLILTGLLIKYIAWTVGLGSVLLHGFAPLPVRRRSAALPASAYPQPSYVPPPPPAPAFQGAPSAESLIPPVPPPEDEDYLAAGGGAPEPKAAAGDRKGSSEPGSGLPEDDEAYFEAGQKPPPRT